MIRPTTAQDVLLLADQMREADKKEVEALSGLDPLATLTLGLFHSSTCITGFGEEGELLGICGVVPVIPGWQGSVWMLTTDAIQKYAKTLVKEGRKWLDQQQAEYPVLTNVVTESNDVHVRLIKHMGFEFKEPIDNYGAAGVRVLPFERVRNV